ncbi:SIMPL domain-containing protein [Streptomyces sp. DSM 44917]|uniref:SIMPL domain-containing protein n=1 Tax=Streptomyces boetiae TaxID=3075541 RepID=A0ABU2LDC1_9ACTN|nr:SIMPL domain-containing protein [Streptomyces sp. DSM 44917]MDT0309565.1 SIMPL domain-containing protein [Streptomyces sp. DSM 44917]
MHGSQSIESPWGVSVFGSAGVSAAPDLAHVRLAVSQTRQKPAESLSVTRGAVNRVREVVRGHGVRDADVASSRLNLRSAWSYGGGQRKFLGYECSASFAVTVRQLDALEPLLVALVEAGAHEVRGVEFDVSTKPELRARARVRAVGAAREKAALYAEAAGVRLGPVIHITDVDAERLPAPSRAGSSASPPAGDPDLAPGAIRVQAAVLLGFSLIDG